VPESGIIWPLTLASAHSRQTVAAVAALAVACLATLYAIVPLWSGLLLITALAWFAVPGIVLAFSLYRSQPGSLVAALLCGAAWGYVLSSLVLLALWATGSRQLTMVIFAPIVATLVILPARRLAGTLHLPAFTRADGAACALLLVTVPLIVGLPFSHVGIDLPEGRAYRAYFTADFVWEMAVVAEVSKGDMPPRNPYYTDDQLHYYWLMHLLPAVEHRAFGDTPRLDQLLLVNAFWSALGFVAFLYFFVRHFVDKPWAAALGCVFVLFCSSFEGTERIWFHWSRGEAALPFLRMLNIDAVTSWIAAYGGMRVDGLHRLLLYQPQHQASYILGMSAILLLHQARSLARIGLFLAVGAFVAGSMLFSSFAALMLALMAAAQAAWRMIPARQWRAMVVGAAAAALPMLAALALIYGLGYVDTSGGNLVVIGLNSLAAHNALIVIFLSFGPVLIGAAIGLGLVLRVRSLNRFAVPSLMLALSAVFYFFVDMPDHTYGVGWHAGKLAFIALTPLVGVALQGIGAAQGSTRLIGAALMTVVTAAALPTVLVDLYNTQDVWNRGNGPAYRWTVLLTRGELEGLDWIKGGTFKSARVQIEPTVRGRDTWAYIPAFAERRMSSGLPISMIPLAKYEKATEQIRQLYQSTDADQAYHSALRHCIDYLVVGPPEREAYRQLEPLLDQHRDLFVPAFRNGTLTVYYVPHDRAQAACP